MWPTTANQLQGFTVV